MNPIPAVSGQVAVLTTVGIEAGIVDQGQTLFPETGILQGGVISPLLTLRYRFARTGRGLGGGLSQTA